MDEVKEVSIWMDAETSLIVDEFRKTQTPIPTKRDALKRLVVAGWKVKKRKDAKANEVSHG
jgi:hypothetical protein